MEPDPNFRLKAFAVIACVLGVFLVAFVAQRVWYWMRTRGREDVDTSKVEPIVDFGLLGVGVLVIWLSIEALVLSLSTSTLEVQPPTRRKVAEIEVGKMDTDTNQMNLLFFPVDQGGSRLPGQRRPVLTSGSQFELQVQTIGWRTPWQWLGTGFYQFMSLGGLSDTDTAVGERTVLDHGEVPRSVGALTFLRSPMRWDVRQDCREGEIYDIFIDPVTGGLIVELHKIE